MLEGARKRSASNGLDAVQTQALELQHRRQQSENAIGFRSFARTAAPASRKRRANHLCRHRDANCTAHRPPHEPDQQSDCIQMLDAKRYRIKGSSSEYPVKEPAGEGTRSVRGHRLFQFAGSGFRALFHSLTGRVPGPAPCCVDGGRPPSRPCPRRRRSPPGGAAPEHGPLPRWVVTETASDAMRGEGLRRLIKDMLSARGNFGGPFRVELL
ncbi:hypothetical protein DFJ74DRAFT_682004, partial [Hyaloraphidium curvatum]